jgi:hypothetical protein
MYGFSPWVDQIDTINQIMKETGENNESELLRKLVDEALSARRKKIQSLPLIEELDKELGDRFHTIESLLIRLVRQGDTTFRIQDVCLALLQDLLAETHASRRLSWESLVVPELREKGVDANELESRFMAQAEQAKNFAYGLAQRIKQSQESTE